MTAEKFNEIFEETIEKSRKVLGAKKAEYTPELDRLSNFKTAADLIHTTPEKALGGMLVKHIVSVFDYIDRQTQGENFTMNQWDEKIIDVINYMILLRALLIEQNTTECSVCCNCGEIYRDRNSSGYYENPNIRITSTDGPVYAPPKEEN